MKINKLKNMKGGWFVGDFVPSVFRTKDFEVAYMTHYKGQEWPKHYHKVASEINYLIRGKMKINREILEEGDIFVIEPGEVVKPEFMSDCELIVVKTPSVVGDKYEIE
ncbi:hypothetical protein KJ953_01565 [Patescibacteria group bacterium]|nr:hypothetical protein [Patescibacteria group bacterium]MBU1256753.1 hypothetical protein [Patescibacteria group bacterium]MBU1457589.1 hypothetical protein [Patescibacteria group bacterium]